MVIIPLKNMFYWSSCCGETGSVASLKSWDTGWIPGLAQWVEYQVLCSADNWTGKSICHGVVKKEKKRKKKGYNGYKRQTFKLNKLLCSLLKSHQFALIFLSFHEDK